MDAPPGIAKFDSASAMTLALARFLHGRDFPGLGQSSLLQALTRRADWLPGALRKRVFAVLGAQEGVARGDIDKVRTHDVAHWAARQYPRRRYPAVMVGSSNGALVHLAGALGIPWLPQTFLTLVRQTAVHPDDAEGAMEAERRTAERFLAANPEVQLHHMHDPSQDRLMLGYIAYFRWKLRQLPGAYAEFLQHSLAPGGTIIVVECERRWPVTRVCNRHVYQFGAEGGPTEREYFEGGERVAAYLARERSPRRRWEPPAPSEIGPEAEWGFEPALGEALREFARERGHRLLRLRFADPEDPSPLVAELHREWNRERRVRGNRLAIESFVVMEPYWVLRTGSVPYWMTFNMQPSLDRVQRYLEEHAPYDELFLMLFSHGVESVGLPPIEAWGALLARAGVRGEFVGLDPKTYPAHFAAFGRYSQALRKAIPARYPLPAPMPLERVLHYIDEHGARYGVRLERD
jgi:hypothetical protein